MPVPTNPTPDGPMHRPGELQKTPTGISGLDDITGGGLPLGRSTLVCGPAGCGKTLLAMEFLVRGIADFGEPGVFVAFEESADDLVANFASLGFDLAQAEADGLLVIDHINVDRGEMEETGDWDLDGLFLRLGRAIDSVGAKRIVIDTIETLFGAFSNTAILRAELHRLFGWLKARGVTAVITGERGDGTLSRHGIEEYVSDCVIVLDHRVTEQTSTRRLRILKYRGSAGPAGRGARQAHARARHPAPGGRPHRHQGGVAAAHVAVPPRPPHVGRHRHLRRTGGQRLLPAAGRHTGRIGGPRAARGRCPAARRRRHSRRAQPGPSVHRRHPCVRRRLRGHAPEPVGAGHAARGALRHGGGAARRACREEAACPQREVVQRSDIECLPKLCEFVLRRFLHDEILPIEVWPVRRCCGGVLA